MRTAKYRLSDLAYELEITENTLLELRRKMKIKNVDDAEYELLKKIVSAIRKKHKKVTLATINDYIHFNGGLNI